MIRVRILDLVSGWFKVMHTYLYYFPLPLSHWPYNATCGVSTKPKLDRKPETPKEITTTTTGELEMRRSKMLARN